MNNNFLFKSQNSVISAAAVIAFATGLSAVLGLLKGRLMTYFFGVSTELAIFYTADRIPNMIYSVLVVGALSTIFIPVFTEEFKKSHDKAWKTASAMINSGIGFFTLIGIVTCIFAYPIINMLSLGKLSPNEVSTGANLMRIMIFSQLILIIGSFVGTILQSFKYFVVPALAPLAYNLGSIFGTILFVERFGIYAPAIGVLFGAILHLLIQIPLIQKTGFEYNIKINFADKGLTEIFGMMPHRILGVLITNIVATVNNSLAIMISTSSVVFLKFATQLQTFPVNLFGASIAVAALPTLSSENNPENMENFKKTLVTSLHQMLFLVMPASVILIVLRIPVVRLVYGVSNFPWEATLMTAYTLAFYGLSIFAQSIIVLITRAYYALKDTKTPTYAALITLFLNIGLSLWFVNYLNLGVWALGLSFTITSLIDLVLLSYWLSKKVGGFDLNALLVPFVKISYASVIMGFVLYGAMNLLDKSILDTTRTLNLILLTGIAGVSGMTVYLLLTRILNVAEIELLYRVLRKLNIYKGAVEAEKVEIL